MSKKIFIYDFDGTLTPHPIVKGGILETVGYDGGMTNPRFEKIVRERMSLKNVDVYSACYEVLLETLKKNAVATTKENLKFGAKDVEYNPGVYDFFDRNQNLDINNYIVSSGSKDFLDATIISVFFKEIYATTFKYDDNGEAYDADFLMSDKRKVEVIKKILNENGIFDEDCSNVVYVGDGLTDLYAMEYVKNHGGETIFVYMDDDCDKLKAAREVDVVSYYTKADYNLDSDFSNVFLDICNG